MMGGDHAERIAHRLANSTLVAVSDPDTERAHALADRFEGVRTVGDPLDLIADDGIDGVIVASPGFVHEEQVLACIAHGTHALCEKPMTMDSASSVRIVAAERAAGRPAVGPGRLHAPVRSGVRPDEGAVGRRDLRAHPSPAQHPSQQGCTGLLPLGDDRPGQPRARGRRGLVHVRRGDHRDHRPVAHTHVGGGRRSRGPAGLDLPDGGRRSGHQRGVRQEPGGLRGALRGRVRERHGHRGPELGRALHDCGRPGRRVVGWHHPSGLRVRFERAYDLEIQAWVDASLRDEVVGPGTWDGYAATAVCEAGIESLGSGRPVAVDLVDRETLT